MRITLAAFLATAVAAAVTQGASIPVDIAAGIALAVLLVTAKSVELYHTPLLVSEWDRDEVAQAVLREPWWAAA